MPEEQQASNAIRYAELNMYDPRERHKDGTYTEGFKLGNKIACTKDIETIAQLIRARAAKGDTSYEKEGRVLGFKEELDGDYLAVMPDFLNQIFELEYRNNKEVDLGWKFCGHKECEIDGQHGRVSFKSQYSARTQHIFWIALTRCSSGDDRDREGMFGENEVGRYGQGNAL
jgi:hypothetical protein